MIDEEGAIGRRIAAEKLRKEKEAAAEEEPEPKVRNSTVDAIERSLIGFLTVDKRKPVIARLLKKTRLTDQD